MVYAVNEKTMTSQMKVVSNASYTTNSPVPMVKVLHDAFSIVRGYMVTVHSYTGDQRTIDTLHKGLHRARAAAVAMIPTSAGAARARFRVRSVTERSRRVKPWLAGTSAVGRF